MTPYVNTRKGMDEARLDAVRPTIIKHPPRNIVFFAPSLTIAAPTINDERLYTIAKVANTDDVENARSPNSAATLLKKTP
jgi:hypothetical protein